MRDIRPYSKVDGSVHATDGRPSFFTEECSEGKGKGVEIAYVTLHVGIGTLDRQGDKYRGSTRVFEEYTIETETAETINRKQLERAEGLYLLVRPHKNLRVLQRQVDGVAD